MSVDSTLAKYLQSFAHLRTDHTGGWTDATKGHAPHKPLLLLVILDLFDQGRITSNLIEISAELGELFAAYWYSIMPKERKGNLALPFFHLRSSKFWHLIPRPNQETLLEITRQVDTLTQLQRLILGAELDDDLYILLQSQSNRNSLRTSLIQTYFSAELHGVLLAQSEMSRQTFVYSQHLIEQARKHMAESPNETDAYQPMCRDQGFRRAIVRIYDHRCAFCGVRMLTSDGRTVVDAAHIIPCSFSHNDDPHNGIALCRLCHWTFDEGLLGISPKYAMMLSPEMRISLNVPGHLLTLENRTIIGPIESDLWPSGEATDWHLQNIFRK